jgi:D-3-phosphoglycerate dehydrogenase
LLIVEVELCGKKLGIVGFSRIGSSVVQVAKSFWVYVEAYDPLIDEKRFTKYSLFHANALNESIFTYNFITAHASQNLQTRMTIREKKFKN